MRIRANQIVGIIIFILFLTVFGLVFRSMESTPSQDNVAGQIPVFETDPERQPVIELETTNFDLGVIDNTEITRAELKVYNRGKGPLRINRIQTSCSACTLGGIDRDRATIPPGGESYIDVAVIPQGIPGFESNHYLTVVSNDPERPMIRVNVPCRVEPEFEVIPEQLDIGMVERGSVAQFEVHYRQLQEERIVIDNVDVLADEQDSEMGGLMLEFEEIPESEWQEPGKAEYRIIVNVLPNTPPGPFNHRFIIESNVARLPQFPYYVNGIITSHYQVTPGPGQRLMLFDDDDEATMEQATATVSADLPIDITNLDYNSDLITVELLPRDNPRMAAFEVGIVGGAEPGQHDSDVTFSVVSEAGVIQDKVAVRVYVPTP